MNCSGDITETAALSLPAAAGAAVSLEPSWPQYIWDHVMTNPFLAFTKLSWYIISLSLVYIPLWLFTTANNLHLTLSIPTLAFCILLIAYVTYCVVKGKAFSQYKSLIREDDEDDKSLHKPLNSHSMDNRKDRDRDDLLLRNGISTSDKGFISSYLDQFLSAIKIFGYLEKPVFHELTKNMRTQKLDEGELLVLENFTGFAIVVEGTLQIYHKIKENDNDTNLPQAPFDAPANLDGNDAENDFATYIHLKDGLGKFQLLNTVKPGNPVTSLVNILNLFTSANSLSPEEMEQLYSRSSDSPLNAASMLAASNRKNSLSPLNLSPKWPHLSTGNAEVATGTGKLSPSFAPRVIARAATDCTIAIIPPYSFAKLTAKYPRSASHIIQMILTKLYRVTFQTAHNYLGLTSEIMNMELLLNRSVDYELPGYLTTAIVKSLDNEQTFDIDSTESIKEANKRSDFDSYKRTSKSNEGHELTRNSSPSPLKRPALLPRLSHTSVGSQNHLTPARGSRHVILTSRDHLNPGDLLSSVPLSRRELSSSNSIPRMKNSSNSLNHEASPSSVPALSSADSKRSIKVKSPLSVNTVSDLDDYSSQQLSSPFDHGLEGEDIKDRLFSAIEEETEDTALRMALVEAMFTYLGINKDNMSTVAETSSPTNADNDNVLMSKISRQQSDASVTSSSYSPASPSPIMLKILPSDFAITSQRLKSKKKPVYKEEVPPNLTFESAKNEFAQGVELKYYPKDTTIVEQNSSGKGLFYVVSGEIDVISENKNAGQFFYPSNTAAQQKVPNSSAEQILFTVETGGIAGYISALIGYKSFVTLRAKTDVYVGFLSNETLERLCDKYFVLYLRIAETLISLLSPRMLKLDHALEWLHLPASDRLFSQGDPANGIYVVLSGRLRQLQRPEKPNDNAKINDKLDPQSKSHRQDENENVVVLGELAQGESFGEVEVLTAINRLSTIVAVRDSELARIPRSLFELLAVEQPTIMFRISRLVARKILDEKNEGASTASKGVSENGYKYDFNLTIPPTKVPGSNSIMPSSISGTNTFRTITILPITSGLLVEGFAMKLVQAFKQVGRTTIGLDQRTALSHLGRHAFDRLVKLKQSGYFAELEERYQTVVYITDTPVNSSWTNTCISQGDCILLLADAAGSPNIGEYEKLLLKFRTTARTELILLHSERSVEPGLTHKWLRNRSWVQSHHHIQFSANSLKSEDDVRTKMINGRVLGLVDRLIQTEFSRKTQHNISKFVPDSIKNTVEHFSARIKKSKTQYYTPLDSHKSDFLRLARILSSQAIGLVLGGGGARGLSHLGVLQAIEEQGIPIDMIGGTSMGAFVGGLYAKDYDLVPIYGRLKKFTGRVSSIWRMLLDLTWPVTSYTTGHEFNRGIWKTFGDTRIEDFWVEYFCNSTNITESVQEIHSFGYAWRYIRASMSLAGLLPPLEEKGSMLLDGGYVDNLPVGEMKSRGCNIIFAVDVGSVDDRSPMNYGDSLNGFWILFNRWNPFSKHPNIPNMAEIQMRLGYVASVNALEKAKHMPGVIYVRPPIEDYATLDFGKFEEIYNVGKVYGHEFLKELTEQEKMPFIPGSKANLVKSQAPEFLSHRRNSI